MSVWLGMGQGSPASTGLGEERKVQVGREPERTELCVFVLFGFSTE